jgi:pimeloyl-ACP methyl ester carboxylesterase/DNA-binding CsgD family transcriptional regulator
MVTPPRRRYPPGVEPELSVATAPDGVRIGWTSVGSGSALVHLPGVPFSNVDAEWRIPAVKRAFTTLGEHLRLIQFDGRGTGRSQRDVTDFSLEANLGDLEAVIDAAGIDECVLLGFYHSVTHAIAWAARHPERVRGIVLFGGATRGWDPMAGPSTQALLSLIERDWGTFTESITHAWLGWPAGEEGRLAAEWFRNATTPTIARATLEAAGGVDVTAEAARVRCPALILHRVGAQVIRLELSEELARVLPNARLEMLPGSSATLFLEGGEDVADRLITFVRDPRADAPPDTHRGVGPPRGSGALSPRETEVLGLVAAGESNGQIAARLGISINTVERHVANRSRKIHARGRAEATAWAIRNGIA